MITITVEEAEAYHAARLFNNTWIDADSIEKPIAIAWASRLIDERYTFVVDYTDPLNVVPDTIKNAIAELAMYVLSKDPNETPNEAKYSYMRFDTMEVKVNDLYSKKASIIPDYIEEMLLPFCTRKRTGSAAGTVGGRRLTRC